MLLTILEISPEHGLKINCYLMKKDYGDLVTQFDNVNELCYMNYLF